MRDPCTTRLLSRALAIALAAVAFGLPDAQARVMHGGLPEFVVEGRAKTFHAPVYGNDVLFFYCPEPPRDIESSRRLAHTYLAKDQVIVVGRSKRSETTVGTMTVKFDGYTAHIKIGGTPDFFAFQPAYQLGHISERAARERQIREEVERQTAILEQAHQDSVENESERRFVDDLARSRQLYPVLGETRADPGAKLSLTVASATWVGTKLYLSADLSNHTAQPFAAGSVTVEDANGKAHPAEPMAMFPLTESDEPWLVAPQQTVRLVVGVDDASSGDFSSTYMAFSEPATTRMAWMAVDRWQHNNPFMKPVPPEQIARERRAQQTSISVRGIFGGFWIGDAAGQDLFDGAPMAGVAVRIQKGYHWGGAFEAEVVGARSSLARFQDIPWSGMTGDISREATLARILAGFAMRFGDRYVSSARVGVGIQVASYDSTFSMGDTSMTGPGDGFEVDAVVSVGAGFDARLGGNWRLGATATLASTFYKGPRSLEAGFHLGYGWN